MLFIVIISTICYLFKQLCDLEFTVLFTNLSFRLPRRNVKKYRSDNSLHPSQVSAQTGHFQPILVVQLKAKLVLVVIIIGTTTIITTIARIL